jgi:hypothetical protein
MQLARSTSIRRRRLSLEWLPDCVTSFIFEGRTAIELERAFPESYLELCAETGQQPDPPFNERILGARNRNSAAKRPGAPRSRV